MDNQQGYPDPSEIRHKIGATGQLTINNVSGSVELRAADTDEAVVNVRSEHGRAGWLPLTVRQSDGVLAIDVEKRNPMGMFGSLFGANDGLDFEVTVPRAARVTVNTVSADIRSSLLSGEQTYKTVSGDVNIDPVGGRIHVTTVSGDIEARASQPAELSVNSTSGDAHVQGAVLNQFDARTVSGDIDIEAGLAAGPLHTVETVSGDLSIESPTGVTVEVKSSMDFRHGGSRGYVSGDGAAKVRFRTLSGDCHLAGARDMHSDEDEGDDRHGRHRRLDRHERSLERRIERQVQRMTRGIGPDFDFPPLPPTPGRQPMPPMPPAPPMAPASRGSSYQPVDQLEILRALERGEIDVDEATRRLQEA
jgi:hypothetical protein